jgi:hypothetical protein
MKKNMTMRRFLFFLLVLWCHTSVFSQSKTEQRLKAIELQRFEAMTQKDTVFLGKILADDLTYNHSNGLFENKKEHIQNISSGKLIYQTMEPVEMGIRLYKKTAVINGIINVAGVLKDKNFNIRLRYTDVYVKKRGHWQLVAWHSVKVE